MYSTLWKPDLDLDNEINCKLFPIGNIKAVTDGLLHIKKMRVFLSERTFNGYCSLLWNVESGLLLNYKSEPEFGEDEIYSIIIDDRTRISDSNFFKLYVQIFELFGAVLLENKEFVTVRKFKQKL